MTNLWLSWDVKQDDFMLYVDAEILNEILENEKGILFFWHLKINQ